MELKIQETTWDEVKGMYHGWDSFKKEDPVPFKCRISSINYNLSVLPISKEIIVQAKVENEIVGTGTIFDKKYEHMRIAGIGRMAINPYYRKNGIAKEILLYMKNIMERNNFDISVLWASVLKVYESVGYKAYYKNMMILPINKQVKTEMLLNLFEMPSKIGYW